MEYQNGIEWVYLYKLFQNAERKLGDLQVNKKPSYKELEERVKELEYAESELAHVEKQSRIWLENSPVCTKIVDLDYNLQYMSHAGIKSLAVDDVTKLYGKPYPFEFFPESFKSLVTANMDRAKETGEIITLEASVVDMQGKNLWFQSTIVPVIDEDRVAYFMIVSADTTARKRAEEELILSQKSEALGTLLGGVAHDFNNMLAIIMCNAEILASLLIKEQSSGMRYLKAIQEAGKRSANLIKQILIFSRTDDFVELRPLDACQIVDETLHLLRPTIPRNIEILQNVPKSCGNILANKTQIHQIIVNLTTNAFHAMEEEGGTLKVTLKKHDSKACSTEGLANSNKACLQMTFQDEGCGIPAKDVCKVFDPFFTTKEVGKGTGLGLSVVYSIVKKHNGNIEINSENSKGTTVEICFPLIDEKDEMTTLYEQPNN